MQQVKIVFKKEKKSITIQKNRHSYYKEILVFSVFTFTIYATLTLFYLPFKESTPLWIFYLASAIYFYLFFLLNRKKINYSLLTIKRDGNTYVINKKFIHKTDVSIKIILYEFAGEALLQSVGNIFLSVNNKEYLLYYAATEETIEYIKTSLDLFFNKKLLCERKFIY